jgi:hypothetical protein
MKTALLLGVCSLSVLPTLAEADTGFIARFVMHRKDPPADAGTICTTYTPNADGLPCSAYVTQGPAPGESLIYFMAVHAPLTGVIGVSFGLDYTGRSGHPNGGIDPDLNEFTLCADGLPFTTGVDLNGDGSVTADEEFPAPKGGARITWVTCQDQQIAGEGVYAVIAALGVYAFSEDVLRITANNGEIGGPELAIATCDQTEFDLYATYPQSLWPYLTGRVQLGGDGSQGLACVDVPAKSATWGNVKALYAADARHRR